MTATTFDEVYSTLDEKLCTAYRDGTDVVLTYEQGTMLYTEIQRFRELHERVWGALRMVSGSVMDVERALDSKDLIYNQPNNEERELLNFILHGDGGTAWITTEESQRVAYSLEKKCLITTVSTQLGLECRMTDACYRMLGLPKK